MVYSELSSLMNLIKKAPTKQLEKIRALTEEELKYRSKLSHAQRDIQNILKKHNLTIQQLEMNQQVESSKSKRRRVKPKNIKTKKVQPKYQDLEGMNFWTGRGLTPNWVRQICLEKKMSLEEFKANKDYRVKLPDSQETG